MLVKEAIPKIKVVHIIFSLNFGGAENLVINILNELSDRFELHLIIINNIINTDLLNLLDSKIMVHKLLRKESSFSIVPIIKLNLILSKISPQIVHCHQCSIISLIFLKKKVQSILTIHEVNIQSKSMKSYGHLISISKAVQEDIYKRYNLNSLVVSNGVPSKILKPINKNSLEGRKIELVQISRPEIIKKGQDILIEAINYIVNTLHFKNIHLDLIGGNEYYSNEKKLLKNLILKYNLSSYIDVVDEQPFYNLYKNLINYDLLIQPSRFEGFGLTIIEAMFCKIPVLVSDIPGPMEVIKDGEYGYYFESENFQSCAYKIIEIYNYYSNNQIKTKVDKAFCYANEHFDISITANNYYNVYQKCLGNFDCKIN